MRTMPDRDRSYYYGWNIVAICLVVQLCSVGIAMVSFSLFVPVWAKEWNTPASDVLLAISLFGWPGMLVGPIVGWAVDRMPANVMMSVGLLATALSYAAVAAVHSSWMLIAVYLVLLCPSVTFCTAIPAQALASRWFDRHRGLAMGITASGLMIAGILYPQIVAHSLPVLGWRGIFLLGAAMLAFVVAPAAYFGLYDRPASADPRSILEFDKSVVAIRRESLSIPAILARPNFWLIAIAYMSMLAIFFSLEFNLAPIALSHGLDLVKASNLLSVMFVAALIALIAVGPIADRFGPRRAFIGLALLASASATLFAFADSEMALLLAVIPLGLVNAVWTLAPATLAVEFGSASFGRAFGLLSATTPVAMYTPHILASLKEQTGGYTQSLLVYAAIGLLGVVSIALMGRSKTPPKEAHAEEQSVPS